MRMSVLFNKTSALSLFSPSPPPLMQKQLKGLYYNLRNSISCSHPFHSTPSYSAKWKNKFETYTDSGPRPTKSYIRYSIRQKRSDAKKALKDLLYNSGCSKPFQDVGRWETDPAISWDVEEDDDPKDSSRKSRLKKSRRAARDARRKGKRMNFCEDFCEAAFGNERYTGSSEPFWEDEDEEEEPVVWRDKSKWKREKARVWDSTSETDEDVKPCFVGSYSDRITLGLPTTGPLNIEDVKIAFRASAKKWHPDTHQGPSASNAAEKFKQCVDSYNSLCKALS